MSEPIKTILHQNGRVSLFTDTDCDNPREAWDNLGEMICFHGRYTLGDEEAARRHGIKVSDFSSFEEMEEALEKKFSVVVPLYMFDHSGIAIQTTPFSCRWDSGQIGFICASRENILKEYDRKRLSKGLLIKVRERLVHEVEMYDKFVRGDVCGYIAYDNDGEEISSCWGYYDEEHALADGLSEIGCTEKNACKADQSVLE